MGMVYSEDPARIVIVNDTNYSRPNRMPAPTVSGLFAHTACDNAHEPNMTCLPRDRSVCSNKWMSSFQEMMDMFVEKCRTAYKCGLSVTIDEQLVSFHGRCRFCMYISTKPGKYGLKSLGHGGLGYVLLR